MSRIVYLQKKMSVNTGRILQFPPWRKLLLLTVSSPMSGIQWTLRLSSTVVMVLKLILVILPVAMKLSLLTRKKKWYSQSAVPPHHQLKEGGEVGERNIRLFLQSMKFHLQLYSPRDMLTCNWISTKSSPPVSTLNPLNKHQGSSYHYGLNAWFCVVYMCCC